MHQQRSWRNHMYKISVLLLLFTTVTFAADQPDAHPVVDAKHVRPALTSQVFVRKASQDGLLEVQAGQLALSKSNDAAIKTFAQKMVTDHSNANTELASIVGDHAP